MKFRLSLSLLLLVAVFSCTTANQTTLSEDSNEIILEGLELPFIEPDDQIIEHTYYTISYNEETEQPEWVAYRLEKWMIGDVDRTNDYREDPSVATGSATLDDYSGSGYHRGHLVPAEDMSWNELAMSETFFLSNMSPQVGSFNTGVWRAVENYVRRQFDEFGDDLIMYVVAGPIYGDGIEEEIEGTDVDIPDKFFKAVLLYIPTENVFRASAFIIPHEIAPEGYSIFDFAELIDEIENVTGIDFYCLLPKEIEYIVENNFFPGEQY
jgi:endonuclease G